MGRGSNIVPHNSSGKWSGASAQISAVNQPQAYENITRIKHEDKQSGGYERFTTKEKVSTDYPHVERGSGRVGVKDEYTTSSTIKIGNKRGYTEVISEEKIRHVRFEDSHKQQKVIGEYKSANDYDYGGGGGGGGANRSYGSEYQAEVENTDSGFYDNDNEGFDGGYSYDDDCNDNRYSGSGSVGYDYDYGYDSDDY